MSRASPASSPERLGDSPYLLAAYAATLPSALVAEQVAASADLVALLRMACLAAFGWHAAVLWRRRRTAGASAWALAAATGLAWTALAVIFLFKVVTMTSFNFSVIVSALGDAARTLVQTLGPHGVALALATLALLACACVAAARGLLWALRPLTARLAPRPLALACLGALAYLVGADLLYAANELVLYPRSYFLKQDYVPAPIGAPDYTGLPVRSGESVFIVQLESVNTLALYERGAGGEGFRARVPQPGVETLLKEGGGVLFPFFWANTTQTNRAWEAILCGISGNLGTPLAGEPARLLRRTCLPRLLGAHGYARVFLYSYFDLDFFNLSGFAAMAGFQEVAYGSKLMAPQDRRHPWAYDDCVFYERAFDYLARQGLDRRERVFAYFEVGMNHWPFVDSRKYPQAHPHRAPQNPVEHYQNALAEQDHCLLTFWKRLRALGRDDIHLFVLPDHGVFVRGLPLEPDSGFATWLAYIPPARRAGEFKPRGVLDPAPSQAQLYPTIIELLGGPVQAGSFGFALRGEAAPPGYADCHLLSEPFQKLVVRRGAGRAEFRLGRDGDIAPFLERHRCP
jgi:phosphoglycerol transferase MdoB-like AlkP superfamily enzyme